MNQTKTGKLIAKCRKEKRLTQAKLAEKLGITDRAVSKWETGKGMPDPSVMLELCKILGITVNELLSGEEIGTKLCEKTADENLTPLRRKGENGAAKNGIFSILFSAVLFSGIIVCLICDTAVSGSLTWSLISVSSIVFAWSILFPIIILGKRGILFSFVSLSILMIPYLFLLSRLIKVTEVFSVGAVIAAASIAYLWILTAVFIRVGRTRKPAALGMIFLSAVPFLFILNAILSKMIDEPVFDIWDMLSVFVLLILAFGSFICDYARRKGRAVKN